MENKIQRLKYKWALWETYPMSRDHSNSHAGYVDTLRKIYTFDRLDEFAVAWSNLQHSSPSNFFYDPEIKMIKK